MDYDPPVPPLIVSIQRLSPNATLPAYATPGAAGMDLSAAIDAPMVLSLIHI